MKHLGQQRNYPFTLWQAQLYLCHYQHSLKISTAFSSTVFCNFPLVKSMSLANTDLLSVRFSFFLSFRIYYLSSDAFFTYKVYFIAWRWCWHSCIRILYRNFLSNKFLWVLWQYFFSNWMELQPSKTEAQILFSFRDWQSDCLGES